MRTRASLLVCLFVLLCAAGGVGQDVKLQAEVERAAARDLGINLQDLKGRLDLQILGSEVLVPEQARLHVNTVHPVSEAGPWLLRMECSSRVECLPFEVVLRTHDEAAARLLPTRAGSASASPGNAIGSAVVHAGQRVQLAEEVSGIHLSASAVCMQAGSMGQRIRVRNVSSGRVVLARVRAAGKVSVGD